MSIKNVTITTPTRQASEYLNGYLAQLDGLDYPLEHLRIVIVEGDSQDDTYSILSDWAKDRPHITLVKHDTGRPKYPSAVMPARFAHLADVFNTCLEAVDYSWSDYVVFSPADVIWGADILNRLLATGKAYVAPMYWMNGENRFYDIWGYTHPNITFGPFGREWYERVLRGQLTEMATVGGLVLIKADILRAGCRYAPANVDHGLCQQAQALGYTVWCDPTTDIWHR